MTDVAPHHDPGAAPSTDAAGRRRFLARAVMAVQSLVGGALGVILGGAIVSPGLARRSENWLPAAKLSDLTQGQPVPVAVRVARQDGYAQVVDRRTVFLIRTGNAQVTALDSTCTHLGCRVSWNAEAKALQCPCHGGVFDTTGAVTDGPPPGPLRSIATRVENGQVLVQM
jgi:menaquinol-cytochrome c reductase iron-sulfur subunit